MFGTAGDCGAGVVLIVPIVAGVKGLAAEFALIADIALPNALPVAVPTLASTGFGLKGDASAATLGTAGAVPIEREPDPSGFGVVTPVLVPKLNAILF